MLSPEARVNCQGVHLCNHVGLPRSLCSRCSPSDSATSRGIDPRTYVGELRRDAILVATLSFSAVDDCSQRPAAIGNNTQQPRTTAVARVHSRTVGVVNVPAPTIEPIV